LADPARPYNYQSFQEPVRPAAPPTGEWLHPFEVGAGVPDRLVESARDDARAAGYAMGWAQGARDAHARMMAEAAHLRARTDELEERRVADVSRGLRALEQAANDLEQRSVPAIEHLEETVIEMAVAIAQAVLGHELRRRNDRVIIQAMARILALVPSNEPVTLRLAPEDHATLAVHEVIATLSPTRQITIVAAPELAPGDVVATCAATEIDARVAPALERIREVLSRSDGFEERRVS
jgi:flagellar assembly protein FliH